MHSSSALIQIYDWINIAEAVTEVGQDDCCFGIVLRAVIGQMQHGDPILARL